MKILAIEELLALYVDLLVPLELYEELLIVK